MELIFKSKFKKNSHNLIRWNIKLKEKRENCIIDFSKNIFSYLQYIATFLFITVYCNK